MDEPQSKRAKRTSSAAMLEDDERIDSRPGSSGRDNKKARYGDNRDGGRNFRRDEDRRKRSRSRDTHERKRDRSRSKDRAYRERDRERERDRDRGGRDRDVNGHGQRERSRSRDRQRPPRDYRNDRSHRRSRSRSPMRNGGGNSLRTRSPRRNDHDRPGARDRGKAEGDESRSSKTQEDVAAKDKPSVNGDSSMAIDDNDEDAQMRRIMGFTKFRSTHNTKVPGNQIYGVNKEKKTEYRQYMNRVGGFNRPLSPSR